MGRGGELFLQAVGLCRQAARPLRGQSRTSSRRRNTATRSSPSSSAASHDLSISRTTFDWGVPVPGDPKHVMYVWVDALTNYITATGFPDDGAAGEILAGRRPCDRQGHHPLSRDLLAGVPDVGRSAAAASRSSCTAFCSTAARRCRSRSATSSSPADLVAAYGVDPLRYFFLREVPFGQDGNYSHEAIVQRMNADLANDLGNLAQRSLSMIAKNCGGVSARLARSRARRGRSGDAWRAPTH